jgi:hypothetical protein
MLLAAGVLHTDKHDNALRITVCESPSVRSLLLPFAVLLLPQQAVLLCVCYCSACRVAGAACSPRLGISRDCAVQNYVCRELLIQVRELLTRYYENLADMFTKLLTTLPL